MKKNLMIYIGVLLAWASFMTACTDSHILYHQYSPLLSQGWSKNDTVTFDIELKDSCQNTLSVFAELRHNCDYPYHNLDLGMEYCWTADSTTTVSRDSVSFTIADKNGEWTGNGWGGLYSLSLKAKLLEHSSPGNLNIKIWPQQPDSLLKGVNNVGIKVCAFDLHQSEEK